MPKKIPLSQCRTLVYFYFLTEGWLPAGTTDFTWKGVTMGALEMDDPPLPSAPDFQKERIALDLQEQFFRIRGAIPSPIAQLKIANRTLGDLAQWCFDNQKGKE